jgi:hypothetical protein
VPAEHARLRLQIARVVRAAGVRTLGIAAVLAVLLWGRNAPARREFHGWLRALPR